jgi:hypothetical protein
MENNNDWGPEGPPFDPKKLFNRPKCTWRQNEDGWWEADAPCHITWETPDGSFPREHKMNFCPQCGKPLVEVPYEEEEEE